MITYDNFHHTRLKLNENGFVDIQLIQLFSRNNWYLNVSNHLEVKIDRSINQLSITRANEITIQSAHKQTYISLYTQTAITIQLSLPYLSSSSSPLL